MALDEPKETDSTFDIDGFQYIIDKEFLERAQPIKVDFLINGFKLDCSIDFGVADGCGSCGSASSGACSV